MFEKKAERRKIHGWTWEASNLPPSNLCSNTYSSLPGGQGVFLLFISIGTLESDLLSQSTPFETLFCTILRRNVHANVHLFNGKLIKPYNLELSFHYHY